MHPRHGLEITVPTRFNAREIPAIIEEHKTWILKHLSLIPKIEKITLPDAISFAAINQTWKVFYIESRFTSEFIERPNQELVLMGDIKNQSACQKKLLGWVREQAKFFLFSELQTLSEQTQLSFSKFTLRDQKTRWGSCTSEKSINLNYKLIFLPQRLMRHVIIHELCHTKYLNHAPKFWQLVAQHDQYWETHKSELRCADQYLPTWI
jgi:predicted metal-dependent hydrolase